MLSKKSLSELCHSFSILHGMDSREMSGSQWNSDLMYSLSLSLSLPLLLKSLLAQIASTSLCLSSLLSTNSEDAFQEDFSTQMQSPKK